MNNRLKMAVILGGLCALAPICTDLYVSGFPIIASDFGVSPTEVQLSMTTCLLGIAAGQLFIGPLSDVYGRRRPLLISLVAFVLTSLGCALAPDVNSFNGLRFFEGIAGAGGIVLGRTIAYDKYRGRDLTEFIALMMMINGVAPIIGPLLGGFLITYMNWQAVFYFLMLCGLALTLAAGFSVAESLPPEKRAEGRMSAVLRSFADLLRNKSYLACLSIHCLEHGVLFSYIAGSPFILQNLYGLTAEHYSWTFAVNGIGMILSARLAAYCLRRADERKQLWLILSSCALIGVLLMLLSFTKLLPLPLLLLLLLLTTMTISVNLTNSFSLAMQNIKGGAGSASGLLGIGGFTVGAVVSPLVGLAGTERMTEMLGLIIFVIMALCLFATSKVPALRRDD